ncbi:MAG: SDR family oxidoreductase [Myxococcota bacterium]
MHRSVLITGASTGIGRAAAEWLHNRGWTVYAGARKDRDLESLAAVGSDRMIPVQLDITDAEHIAAATDRIGDTLDGVVNNAGVGTGGPIECIAIDDLRRQFEVNVFAQVAVTQAVMPALRARKGRIVNIGSIGGRIVSPMLGPYCASKFALQAITHALRQELAPEGMHVALIEPGVVNTDIWGKAQTTAAHNRGALTPEAEARYATFLDVAERRFQEQEGGGVDSSVVAKAIEHALSAPTPKTRYLIGNDAKMGAWLRWLGGDRTVDRMAGKR